MGGLTKEWFQLLVKQIFEPDYGMFVYHPNSRCYWFSVSGSNKNLREYNLIGVLMGLAVYNRYISYSVLNISPQNVSVTKHFLLNIAYYYYFSIILDLHFPSICYRKLLTPPVVPANDDTSVGIAANPSLDDLAEIMPEVAHSMKEILDYKGDVCEDLLLSFEGIFI